MNSFQIKYFLVLCEELNYAKASAKLSITQQGLNKSIKALETELGVPLVIRKDGKMSLTSYGEYAREHLSCVLDKINNIRNELAEMRSNNSKIISVAILEGYCKDKAFTLDDLLGPTPPDIKMIPHICTFEEGIQMLEENIVDLFIAKGPITDEKLSVLDTVYEHFYAVIPENDSLAEKSLIGINDLRNKKLIIFNEKYKNYKNFFAKCERYGFIPSILNTADEASAIFLPCILGDGIGIVPEFSIRSELNNVKQIKIVPFASEMDEEMCFSVLKGTITPEYIKSYVKFWKRSKS